MNDASDAGTEGADKHIGDFPRAPESAHAARRLVEKALDSWDMASLADDADLIISELVTNAVRHTRTDQIRVSVARVSLRRVRLGVIDKSRDLPHQEVPHPDAIEGRGLHMVDGLADCWGTDRYGWGKRVWAELADGERR